MHRRRRIFQFDRALILLIMCEVLDRAASWLVEEARPSSTERTPPLVLASTHLDRKMRREQGVELTELQPYNQIAPWPTFLRGPRFSSGLEFRWAFRVSAFTLQEALRSTPMGNCSSTLTK